MTVRRDPPDPARLIDAHAHWYPQLSLDRLTSIEGGLITRAMEGNQRCLKLAGHSTALQLDDSMNDLDARRALLDENNIDIQLLSFGAIDVGWVGGAAPEVARVINDDLASVAATSDRFRFLAAVPLDDPIEVSDILADAVANGAVGVGLTTTYRGLPLDAEELRAGWSVVAEVGLPISIHPCLPRLGQDRTGGEFIPAGFPAETSLAAARVIISGLVEQMPALRLLWSHGGGGTCMVMGRISAALRMTGSPRDIGDFLDRSYFDVVTADPLVIRSAAEAFGVDHLVYGTDMPHRLESPTAILDAVDEAISSTEGRAQVLFQTAERLFGLSTTDAVSCEGL